MYRDINEDIQFFEESQQRTQDEHYLEQHPACIEAILKQNGYDPTRVRRVNRVILTGDSRSNKPDDPFAYETGYVELEADRLCLENSEHYIRCVLRWSAYGSQITFGPDEHWL